MKLFTSALCVHSAALSRLSHWLYDISSISNSVTLSLMNFSRTGYPGQFLKQCTLHSRLVVSHTTMAIKSLCEMSNFGTSMFLSSDSPAFLFNWVFTAEQKETSIWCFDGEYKHIQNVYQTKTQSNIIYNEPHRILRALSCDQGIFLCILHSFFRLLNSRHFCLLTLLAMLSKSFPPDIILENLSSS